MWRTHAGTGALFGLAAIGAPLLIGVDLPIQVMGAFPVVSAYASAIPDVDHHSAKIRYAAPPARWLFLFARLITRLCLGEEVAQRWFRHRGITHTYWFAVSLGGLISWALLLYSLQYPFLLGWAWVGIAVTVGCIAHVEGDCKTNSGCPRWAPFSWRRCGSRRFSTNSESERTFAVCQTVASAVLATVITLAYGGGQHVDQVPEQTRDPSGAVRTVR